VPQDAWNKLDFIVVFSSWINIAVELFDFDLGIEVSTLRALRILRVLRSLRFLQGIKTIMAIVAQAIPAAFNVVVFLGFLFVVMGIIGVQMFRGKTIHRCAPGAWDLMASYGDQMVEGGPIASTSSLAAEIHLLSSPVLGEGESFNSTNFPARVCDGSQGSVSSQESLGLGGEYPIGIGMWHSYCGPMLNDDMETIGLRHSDCPLFNQSMYDETGCSPQLCFVVPNPGKGVHSYDNILFAWVTLFINMAQLYWWETAHRYVDSGAAEGWEDLGSKIAWSYGITNIFLMTYVTVNMFVAVITTTFADVRSVENAAGGLVADDLSASEKFDAKFKKYQAKADSWKPPFYFVGVLGGEGPFKEKLKPAPFQYPMSVAMRDEIEVEAYLHLTKETVNGTVIQLDDAAEVYKVKWGDTEEQEQWVKRKRISVPKDLEKSGIINQSWFDQFILMFIFANTIALASEHHDPSACQGNGQPMIMCQGQDYVDFMGYTEYVFNFVFTCECIMKICGMGFKQYIAVGFNKLDFFIVCTSAGDMLSALADHLSDAADDEGGGGIFKLFRVFRLFRVLRVARVLYRNESLKKLLMTVFGSGEALGNLTLFILFATLLFGIMGMHLFGGNYIGINGDETFWGRVNGAAQYYKHATHTSGTWADFEHDHDHRHSYGYDVAELINKSLIPRRNFEDLPRAFLLAFQIITGDDWVNQMHDHMYIYNLWTPPLLFFTSFVFCNYTLLSLFIAVILENFEIAEGEKLELQKQAAAKAIEDEIIAKSTARVSFVNRLIWFVGGEGKREESTWSYKKDLPIDDEGYFLPGSKWYNDDLALFTFAPEHPLRKACKSLAEHQLFDNFILLCIIVSTGMLIYEGPPGKVDQEVLDVFAIIGHCLFFIFMVEFMSKAIGFGFLFTPRSYIKDPWNKLDFIVIMATILGYVPGQEDSQLGRILRLGRCLRPLRMINRNEGMKVIITAVIGSLGVNLSVVGLMGMLFLIFGILGVNLFAGQFWFCNCFHVYPVGTSLEEIIDGDGLVNGSFPYQVMTKDQCIGPAYLTSQMEAHPELDADLTYHRNHTVWGVDPNFPDAISKCTWENPPYSFDSVSEAMMALFTASTLAGWTDIMERGMDMGGFNHQPVYFKTSWAVGYFMMFVFAMAFFITNLFIGVLIDFISQSDGSALLTEEQQTWIDTQRFQKAHSTVEAEVDFDNMNPVRRFFWKLCDSEMTDNISNFVIIFNVVVMMCEYEGIQYHPWHWHMSEYLNYLCLIYFTVEMACKLLGYWPAKYWSDHWNKFDGVVVTVSWAAIILDAGSVQAVRAFRAFRIVLVLKRAKGIRSLFGTLIMSLPAASNIAILLLLLYVLFAILGMQLFGTARVQDSIYWTKPIPQSDLTCAKLGKDAGCFCDDADIAGMYPIAGCARFVAGPPGSDEYEQECGNDLEDVNCIMTAGRMLHGGNRQYSSHASFRNFPDALAVLFQCAAGQDWKFVMYALEDPENGVTRGVIFGYFFSFFFFSNYILLNLFVAVILDNFSACLREESLEISEEQIVVMKETFRDMCTEDSVERIYFKKLEAMLMALSDKRELDEFGNESAENPLAPPAVKAWSSAQTAAWREICSSHTGATAGEGVQGGDSLVELVRAAYEYRPLVNDEGELCNPLYGAQEPSGFHESGSSPNGENFDAFWSVFLKTRTTSETREGEGDAAMEAFLAAAQGGNEGSFDQVVTFDEIEDYVRRLRFRAHYMHLIDELDFHSVKYLNVESTIRYTDLLQSMVNARLGTAALSLEQQVERGLVTIEVAQDTAAHEQVGADGRAVTSNPIWDEGEDGDADGENAFEGLEQE
jgi:hypothetical protein